MRFLKFFAIGFLFAIQALAENQFVLEGGFRQQNGETPSGITAKPVTGYQFGGLGYFPVINDFYFRTGLLYTQRTLKGDRANPPADYEYKMNYVDVPLTGFYKFSEFGGVFAGVVLANNFEKSWSVSGQSVDDSDVRSTVIPAVLGASFKFLPQVGMSVFYELIPGDVARDLGNYRAVGVNLSVYFE